MYGVLRGVQRGPHLTDQWPAQTCTNSQTLLHDGHKNGPEEPLCGTHVLESQTAKSSAAATHTPPQTSCCKTQMVRTKASTLSHAASHAPLNTVVKCAEGSHTPSTDTVPAYRTQTSRVTWTTYIHTSNSPNHTIYIVAPAALPRAAGAASVLAGVASAVAAAT